MVTPPPAHDAAAIAEIAAFPEVPGDYNAYEGRPGMTLRDWFAGQCLASIARSDVNTSGVRQGTAEWAYAQADAMLSVRASLAQSKGEE